MTIDRRKFAAAGACAGLGIMVADRLLEGAVGRDRRWVCSRVAVVETDSYSDRLEDLLCPRLRRSPDLYRAALCC